MYRSRMFIQTVGGMRAINLIVVHCSATREDRDFTEQDLDAATGHVVFKVRATTFTSAKTVAL